MSDTRACPECGTEITTQNLPRHRRNVHGVEPAEGRGRVAREEAFDTPEESSPYAGDDFLPEPATAKAGWFGRWKKPKGETPPPRQAKERKPKRSTGRRKDASGIFGLPFEFGSEVTRQIGLPATSRMLAAEAPWAGYVLDDAISGTMVDRLFVQPIAKVQDRVGMITSVVGPPGLVFQMETHPERIPMLLPALAWSLREAAPYIAQGLKKKRKADEAAAEAMRDLYPDAPDAATLGQYMIGEIFGASYEDLMNHGRMVAQQRAAAAQPQAADEEETEDVTAA